MTSRTRFAALLLTLCILLGNAAAATADHAFPDLLLSGKLSAEDKDYLGLPKGTESFKLTDLPADIVFVEVFSMYCPICQRDAPIIEELYATVEEQGYRPGMVMLGVGAGNSQFEVDFYRKKYGIHMPLLPDADYVNHKKVGSVGTPYYILLKKNSYGELKVLFSQEGGVQNKNAFIRKILKLAAAAD